MWEKTQFSREKSMGSAVGFPTDAAEMRHIVHEALRARPNEPAKRAIPAVARDLGLSANRISDIVRGRVARVWSDEIAQARGWYARFCERQAQQLAIEAEIYKARRAAFEETTAP